MKLVELGVLYGLVGVGCAAVVLVRGQGSQRFTDAALMLGLWPLYGPFLLTRLAGSDEQGCDVTFLAALRRASGTPLAALLPDQQTVRALAHRLRVADSKVHEIDSLLRRREFDLADAERRHRELLERSASEYAISTAASRLQNIRRLRGLRDRFARELDEVGELLVQLRTQVEVVRLAGGPDDETRDLVQELVSRVDGLDRMLDEDPYGQLQPSVVMGRRAETERLSEAG